MIIGLTGRNGAGKGAVADFLKQTGYTYHSLSDVIRDELAAKGLPPTRENMIPAGNALRSAGGAGVLAERILQRVTPDVPAIIDSIRNPVEVETLRRRPDFFLIAVDADPKIRFERMKSRRRPGDPDSFEAFLEFELREASSSDPTTQQMNATVALADVQIQNDGTFDDLQVLIRGVIKERAAKEKRPSWDDYFMDIAHTVARRSNCMKRHVAAIIVKDKRIISTGYNGTPRGIENCNEGGCPRCASLGLHGEKLTECLCAHAEENAIVQAAYHGVAIQNSTLYSTFSPCFVCTRMIINSGISEVVFSKSYAIEDVPMGLLKRAGVRVRQIGC